MTDTLLAYGADPNGGVYAGGTPPSEAYGQRDDRMIALLERSGGEPNPSTAGVYGAPGNYCKNMATPRFPTTASATDRLPCNGSARGADPVERAQAASPILNPRRSCRRLESGRPSVNLPGLP